MELKGQTNGLTAPALIGIMVAVIIGLSAVVAPILDQQTAATTASIGVFNETFTLTDVDQTYSSFSKVESGVLSITSVTNQTFVIPAANYTLSDNVLTFSLSPNAYALDQVYGITYTYEPSTYVEDSSQRTLITLIALFVILGLVFFVLRSMGLF